MITDFNLVNWLRSWFHAKDAAIHTGGRDINTGGGDVIVGAGTVDGVDVGAHPGNTDAHHNQSHVLATGTALGGDHTISGAADGQVLRASSSTAARFDPLAHADLGSVTANQHHNESHSVASHSDTSATGSELNTLTDGSDASSLHDHDGRYFQESEFSDTPGSASKPLESSSAGKLTLVDLVITNDVDASSGTVSANTLRVNERASAPGTPPSGSGYIYFKSSDNRLYYKTDGGLEYGPL